jgi:rare lipoprotein A
LLAVAAACHPLTPTPTTTPTTEYRLGFSQVGLASWYGADFQHRRTANGERFDMHRLTAAHRSLPLNSHVLVTMLATGRSVVVRISDRGPFIADRIIDLSARAASELGMKENGIARVRLELVSASEASLR